MTQPLLQTSDLAHEPVQIPHSNLRPPSAIMRLDRMGSFFPTRLSFLRSLLRDLAAGGAQVEQTFWELDAAGYGDAVYTVSLDGKPYSLICYASPLDDEDRTDRVIAEAWDACFVLLDGIPNAQDVAVLRKEAVRQEAGRYHDRVLVLSRANKSVRLFEHVVNALAAGEQPDLEQVSQTGYLMRTTAVYGNGKFGLADRATIARHPDLRHPFRLEMLTVWLIREFTLDLVDHVARMRGGERAVQLSRGFRRQLGIGNSTGLGMAPFLVSHPALINNWMMVRETALARVRAIPNTTPQMRDEIEALCGQLTAHLSEWNGADEPEQARIEQLRAEWHEFAPTVLGSLSEDRPFDVIFRESEKGSADLQELTVSLLLEPNGDLVDGLCDCMGANESKALDPSMTIGALNNVLNEHYVWCRQIDTDHPQTRAMVWYVSEEKLEPRLGKRRAGANDNCEMPHAIAHFIAALRGDLCDWNDQTTVAEFLAAAPQHRHIVRRVQLIAKHPYGEIQDNLLADTVRPIDLLRCKLSFFGASRFDPRSDRWTRITLFQGAPCADELNAHTAGDCFFPSFAAGS